MNDYRQAVSNLFAALSFDKGNGPVALDENDEALMNVEDALVVRFRANEERGTLSLSAYLIEMPDGADATFLLMLLQANYLLFTEQAITLAVDEAGSSVLAVLVKEIEGLSGEQFAGLFGAFVENSLLARNAIIAGALERDKLQKSDPAEGEESMWTRV